MKYQLVSIAIVFSVFLVSCGGPVNYDNLASSEVSLPRGANPDGIERKSSSQLGAGDLIQLTYPGAPEYDQKQKIRLNNRVSLPLVGDVVAGGKEVKLFQQELTKRYAKHLQNPNVVVTLESTAAAVYVSGYVEKPQKIALDRPMTALEAIMESGGFNKFGSPKRVSVVRKENGTYRKYNLNLDAALQGTAKPFQLHSNDMVYVR